MRTETQDTSVADVALSVRGLTDKGLKTPDHTYTRRLIAAVPHLHREDRVPVAATSPEPVLKVRDLVKTCCNGSKLFRIERVAMAGPPRRTSAIGQRIRGHHGLCRPPACRRALLQWQTVVPARDDPILPDARPPRLAACPAPGGGR